MERAQVVQKTLEIFANAKYLEIGVDSGQTFHSLQAKTKIAVDPNFKFPVPINEHGSEIRYYQVTSDEFFAAFSTQPTRFDVIYIDGLHTFEQVVRDLLNAIEFINHYGVIIIDDITPTSYHASLPSLNDAFTVRDYLSRSSAQLQGDATWMGDVYKTAFFVNTFLQQYDYATVAENHGQLLVWRRSREPEELGQHTIRDLAFLEFKDTITKRSIFKIAPLEEIIKALRARSGFK